MKLTNKLNKLRTRALVVAGLVTVLGTYGCVTPQGTKRNDGRDEALVGLGLMNLGHKENNPRAVALGKGLLNYGSAKANRSQVNININTNEGRRKRSKPKKRRKNSTMQGMIDKDFLNSEVSSRGQFYYFTANYVKNFNEDRYLSPNEFVGIKKRFREDEKLILVSYDGRTLYGQRSLEVYSPRGEKIYERRDFKDKCDSGDIMLQSPQIYKDNHVHKDESGAYIPIHTCKQRSKGFSLIPFLVKKSGYGNYKTVWRINGEYDGSTEFEIVPSLGNKKHSKR